MLLEAESCIVSTRVKLNINAKIKMGIPKIIKLKATRTVKKNLRNLKSQDLQRKRGNRCSEICA